MKSVLISIQPKWCELIASGKKTVEVRKTKPKLDVPFKCYIYQTKMQWVYSVLRKMGLHNLVNRLALGTGKVIGEFVCKNIECFTTDYRADKEQTERISKQSCVSWLGMEEYEKNSICLYGWHISDLVIYDKPKDLDCFRKPIDCHRGIDRENCKGCWDCEIKRPPQSWCYVESEVQGE